MVFLSTLPARGATLGQQLVAEVVFISIHAPREGSDGIAIGASDHRVISIHAPREGSDARWWWCRGSAPPFLSTLPARGATGRGDAAQVGRQNFYPRSPRGERR